LECINQTTAHFFSIGDWGGPVAGIPLNNIHGRPTCPDIDGHAQKLVADVMNARAAESRPSFILNVGDSFYVGGIPVPCGSAAANPSIACDNGVFSDVFEDMYKGPGMDNVPWFSVLGNHDYGGVGFGQGWDVQIFRTYCKDSRWRMPGVYWKQKVQFRDFSLDIFMLDSNWNDAISDPHHMICQGSYTCNVPNATMHDAKSCSHTLNSFWSQGMSWLDGQLAASTADWRIAVTHFPPTYQGADWKKLVANNAKNGALDLILSGHTHAQLLHKAGDPTTGLGADFPTWIISGGGGGITSEGIREAAPTVSGHDDGYGFMDLEISVETIKITAISHGGKDGAYIVRNETTIYPISAGSPPPLSTLL